MSLRKTCAHLQEGVFLQTRAREVMLVSFSWQEA